MARTRSNPSLSHLGERGFLKRLLPSLARQSGFRVPPGDDAAVMRGAKPLALSIDGLTEGTHFRLSWDERCRRLGGFSLARGLGWKLMGSSLSDLAAMGDTDQRWAMIYLAAPGSIPLSFLSELQAGVAQAARRFACALAGGDTVRAPEVSLVAAVGGRMKSRAITRGGARPGDVLAVAGAVGDASAGLAVLEGRLKKSFRVDAAYFVRRFFDVRPMFDAGRTLSRARGVTAMLDLSDSVKESVDLLCDASGVRAEVTIDALPVSPAFRRSVGLSPAILAGGEDYALLFSARSAAIPSLKKQFRFSVIGRILPRRVDTLWRWRGKSVAAPKAFTHFSS